MTYEEMEEERKGEEERAEIESDDEEEEGGFYNPLNLPMGVDGKPIPYWLFKLHGLGQVCSKSLLDHQCYNNTYMDYSNFVCCYLV